jgi:hypothetical protein
MISRPAGRASAFVMLVAAKRGYGGDGCCGRFRLVNVGKLIALDKSGSASQFMN